MFNGINLKSLFLCHRGFLTGPIEPIRVPQKGGGLDQTKFDCAANLHAAVN